MVRQAANLFKEKADRKAFLDALVLGESKEQAIIVLEDKPEIKTFPKVRPLAWQPSFVHRIPDEYRVSKHPLHAKGAFYCLDFSSIFSVSALREVQIVPRNILDMCSAPGGKAIFAWRYFEPDVLICNESLRKRARTLIGNLDRCKIERSLVWTADPSVWGRKYPEGFDLIICDVPCSGQSLLAKGEETESTFAPHTIDMCVGRQRRIMAEAVKALRPGGYILYCTCTYAIKENEKVMAWLLENNPKLEAINVPHLEEFRSKFSPFPSYRLYPQDGLGAGAFTCLLRSTAPEKDEYYDMSDIRATWRYGDPFEKSESKDVALQQPTEDDPLKPKRKKRQHFPPQLDDRGRRPRPVYKGRSSGRQKKK